MGVSIDELRERAGFRSRDALAQRVVALWGDPKQKPRSIGIKLAELAKGKTVWWRHRGAAARALATALNVDQEELGLTDLTGESIFVFRDFPLARGFDARGEVPCQLGNEAWFAPIGSQTRWIHAPPGTGRSFTAHVHRYRHGTRVVRVPTLMEALPHIGKPGPLLVEVERADDKDWAAEQQLLTRGSVLVIAPFLCWNLRTPAPPQDPHSEPISSLEFRPEPPAAEPPDWAAVLSWVPRRGWRQQFIRWICERVATDVDFNLEDMFRWLDQQDPQARLFATPGDLLPLCAFAHERGRSWKHHTRGSFIPQWLDSRLSSKDAAPTSQQLWLRHQGKESLRALVQRWFQSPEPWLGSLAKSRWLEFLPEELTRITPSTVQRHVDELLKLPKRLQARKRDELLAAFATPNPEDAFLHLTSAGLFQPEGDETWSFRYAWLANLIAQELIESTLRAGSPEQWGRWAVQLDRRDMIDALIDELREDELLGLIDRTVTEFRLSSLGAIGAVEALFAAVGRRLGQGLRFDAARVLPLWEQQKSSLGQRADTWPHTPLTRPDAQGDTTEWLELCWLWSFHVEAPDSIPAELEWLFPGWTRPALARAPHWLSAGRQSPLLLSLAIRAVERCEGETLPQWLPYVLLPAFFLAAEQRGWRLTPDQMVSLIGISELSDFLLRKLESCPLEVRQERAARLWAASLSRGNIYFQEKPGSPLRRFFEEHLTWEHFRASLTDQQLRDFALSPQGIPPHLHSFVMKEAIQRWPNLGSSLLSERSRLTADVLELLLHHHDPRWQVIRAFWKWHPDRARVLAQEALQRGDPETRFWFWEASPQETPWFLQLLEAQALPLAPWVQPWIAWRLPQAGTLAERFHALWLKSRPSA